MRLRCTLSFSVSDTRGYHLMNDGSLCMKGWDLGNSLVSFSYLLTDDTCRRVIGDFSTKYEMFFYGLSLTILNKLW